MPTFSNQSKKMLETLDPRLQKVCNSLIKWFDFKILQGHRNKEDQDKAYNEGKSKVKWPNGKHNANPSLAVDIAPYPIDWRDTGYLQKQIQKYKDAHVKLALLNLTTPAVTENKNKIKKEIDDAYHQIIETVQNIQKWFMMIGGALGAAQALDIDIRSGADWNQNEDTSDNQFNDLPHIELMDKWPK